MDGVQAGRNYRDAEPLLELELERVLVATALTRSALMLRRGKYYLLTSEWENTDALRDRSSSLAL